MTKLEVERFIDEEVKGLWPQWDVTDAELRVWMSSLAPFDYGPACAAARACFREQTVNSRRPILGRFLACLRTLSSRARDPSSERSDPTTDVFVECYEPPLDRPHLAGARRPVYVTPASRQGDREYVRTCAASMAARFDRLYGGHWIVVRIPISQDDGLRGQPARQRAYGRIAAGPDTPGRRFLQNFLARQLTDPSLCAMLNAVADAGLKRKSSEKGCGSSCGSADSGGDDHESFDFSERASGICSGATGEPDRPQGDLPLLP